MQKSLSKKRGNLEAKLQVAFINWMRAALPDVTVWHVMNEGAKNEIQGSIRKTRGVLAGVHDNHLMWAGRNFATIELKSPEKKNAKYDPLQSDFGTAMDKAGFKHFCCQNGFEIEAAVRSLGLKPLFRFPVSLAGAGKQMLMQQVFEAMRP